MTNAEFGRQPVDDIVFLVIHFPGATLKEIVMARTKKAAPVEEVEEAAPAQSNVRGTAWLTEHVNEECGTDMTSAQVRTLLRRMVRNGELEREIGEDRSRYEFPKGANDPIVKAVVKAVKSGEAKEAQRERLEQVKAKASAKSAAAEKPAAKKAAPKGRSRSKAKAAEVIDDDDFEDIEEL